MKRLDRALGILLILRSQRTVPAQQLAERFEVSSRTIYRDVETLAELGIPVYAEMGRNGGFRLMDSYFMPPVTFNFGEAMSAVLGLAFLQSLRVRPFPRDLETAQRKLISAMPESVRRQLIDSERILGFERQPFDIFHREPDDPHATAKDAAALDVEADAIGVFLRAIAERRSVEIDYRSPYAEAAESFTATPLGVFWDRDRWYLVIERSESRKSRTLRSDRVRRLRAGAVEAASARRFDVRTLLDRRWLQSAMDSWSGNAPVRIRLKAKAATRLQRDWYYRHGRFESQPDGQIVMSFGEGNREIVFALLRWLGSEAELLEPDAWRIPFAESLESMARAHRRSTARHGSPR